MAAVAQPGQVPFIPPAGGRRGGARGGGHPPSPPVRSFVRRADPVSVLVGAFGGAALAYALAGAALFTLALAQRAPAPIQAGDPLAHLLLAAAGAVLSGLGAIAYDLPRHADRRLRFVSLGWMHFVLMNGAFLGGALVFGSAPWRTEVSWAGLLVAEVLAQVAGLAAMGGNVIATFLAPPAPADDEGTALR